MRAHARGGVCVCVCALCASFSFPPPTADPCMCVVCASQHRAQISTSGGASRCAYRPCAGRPQPSADGQHHIASSSRARAMGASPWTLRLEWHYVRARVDVLPCNPASYNSGSVLDSSGIVNGNSISVSRSAVMCCTNMGERDT